MGGSCSTDERDKKCLHYFFGKPEVKRRLGRSRRIWEDNIRMDLRERGWEGVDRMHVTQDRDKWQALSNTVMTLRIA
jgi:hypothetical protein